MKMFNILTKFAYCFIHLFIEQQNDLWDGVMRDGIVLLEMREK